MLCSLTGDKHLSAFRSLTPFISFVKTPLPNFGFLARGVYHRFSLSFLKESSLWHFIAHSISFDLGLIAAVSKNYHRLFIPYARTLQSSQTVLAWTFLKSRKNSSVCLYIIVCLLPLCLL